MPVSVRACGVHLSEVALVSADFFQAACVSMPFERCIMKQGVLHEHENRLTSNACEQDYIKLHQSEIAAYRREDSLKLPEEFDYRSLPITTEEKELLSTIRPATLGQASRTPGVRPTSVRPPLQHVTPFLFNAHSCYHRRDREMCMFKRIRDS